MIEIRELAPGQLAEAADFAAQQFGCDISAAQPKLYGPRAAGSTYGAFIQGKMAGMLSVYGMTYRSLRWLSVGSVCCAPLYRGRGVMRALFSFWSVRCTPSTMPLAYWDNADFMSGLALLRYTHFWSMPFVFLPSRRNAGWSVWTAAVGTTTCLPYINSMERGRPAARPSFLKQRQPMGMPSTGWKNTGEPLMRPAVRIITASQSCAEPCRWRTPAA